MVDFTTLPVPEPLATPQMPVAGAPRNGWITALIVVLAVLAIGMIVYGVYQNEVYGTKRQREDSPQNIISFI